MKPRNQVAMPGWEFYRGTLVARHYTRGKEIERLWKSGRVDRISFVNLLRANEETLRESKTEPALFWIS